jgi:hypothetical protein
MCSSLAPLAPENSFADGRPSSAAHASGTRASESVNIAFTTRRGLSAFTCRRLSCVHQPLEIAHACVELAHASSAPRSVTTRLLTRTTGLHAVAQPHPYSGFGRTPGLLDGSHHVFEQLQPV